MTFMKRLLIPLAVFLVLVILALAALSWWRTSSVPVSAEDSLKDFLIVRGRTASQVGQKLFEAGLIRSPLAFKFYVQVTGKAERINAGEFRLSPSMSLSEIVDKLGRGPVELWLTVPEGLRREEVVERFVEGLGMDAAQASVFRKEFLEQSKGKEGFLFPDTYLFPRDVDATLVVNKLAQTFEDKTEVLGGDISSSSYTELQVVTLASIIERETKTDEERPVVAGILFNRLDIGMALQTDATVQYAIANENCKKKIENCDWWPILTKQDLEINSPYNSYKFTGLPPAPIANPGISSIRAVIHPGDTDYLYYIHDPEGNIHYAETLSEHNANIRKYLKK